MHCSEKINISSHGNNLTGLSITAAEIQPERLWRLEGRSDHFLVTGENISILFRSFLVPIPPTAKIKPL